MLVSAVKQSESATCTHTSPPSGASPPPPSLPGHHIAPKWAAGIMQQLPNICFTHGSVCMSVPTSQFIPHSPHIHMSTLVFFLTLSIVDRKPVSSLEQWFSKCDWQKETWESPRLFTENPCQNSYNNTKKLFTLFYWVTFANVVMYITAGILAQKGRWHQTILLVATGFFTTMPLQFLKKSILPKNVLDEGITAIT